MDERITGYAIAESLGVNPWGESFKARQLSLDRTVHLTILRPEAEDPAVHRRARICAGLTHPHVVSGIDFGKCPGGEFLVTEWVEGPSVGEIVRRADAIAEERSLEVALAATRGLEYAFDEGLVHGSVTPEALVIAPGGNPKLRGFGPDKPATRSDLDWRSPEQKGGREPDLRSDLYSLGMVLYFMLSGRHPFEDAPPAEVVDGVVVEAPYPLAQANRRLHPDTVTIVEWILAPSAAERFGTAGELATALEKLIEDLESRVSFKKKRASRPLGRRIRGSRARRRRRR
ncbi:MAG: serine/threonine-protein kinase [Planctomycetota bacterium]